MWLLQVRGECYLSLICDTETVSGDGLLKHLIEYLSAFEYCSEYMRFWISVTVGSIGNSHN